MASLRIEHVNVTVSDAERTARLLERLFGWRVRWQGPAQNGGRTIHVGTDSHYVAVYTVPRRVYTGEDFIKGRPLNHIGVEVDDLDATEARVAEAGLTPFSHGDYEPGRRFYFLDPDGIEYEVVSYQPARAAHPAAAEQRASAVAGGARMIGPAYLLALSQPEFIRAWVRRLLGIPASDLPDRPAPDQ